MFRSNLIYCQSWRPRRAGDDCSIVGIGNGNSSKSLVSGISDSEGVRNNLTGSSDEVSGRRFDYV